MKRWFYARTWQCLAEAAWAAFGKSGGALTLDLGLLTGNEPDFTAIFHCCRGGRRSPPLLPDAFAQRLTTAKFLKPDVDRPLLVKLYTESFAVAMARVRRMECAGLYWGDAEADMLCVLLKSGVLTSLISLNLDRNGLSTEGLRLLTEALADGGCTPNLLEVSLCDNLVSGDRGTAAEQCKGMLVKVAAARGFSLQL